MKFSHRFEYCPPEEKKVDKSPKPTYKSNKIIRVGSGLRASVTRVRF